MSDFRSDAQKDWSDRMKDSEGTKPSDEESLQERIATMLDEKTPAELDRIISDHVDYEAFVSSQRAMIIAYKDMIDSSTYHKAIGAAVEFETFVKSHCNILLTALEKACKDK